MAIKIIIKHGAKADIPTTGMTLGEALWCSDTRELFMAFDATNSYPVAIDLEALTAIGTIATDDLLYMYDISATAGTPKYRKVSFADFKTALNIPAGSSDEKVAVISGGTSGYLWGTTGSDGVIRMGNGLAWTKDAGNGYVTLKINIASEAQGDIMYRGASTWDRLAAGAAAGYLLQTGGSGANPSWTSTIDGGTFV
jgi:hypothetical protein